MFHCSFERLLQLLTSDGENLGIYPCGAAKPSQWAAWVSVLSHAVIQQEVYGISTGMNAKGFLHLVLKLKEPFAWMIKHH